MTKLSKDRIEVIRQLGVLPFVGQHILREVMGHIDAQDAEMARKDQTISNQHAAIIEALQLRTELEELKARHKLVVLPREVADYISSRRAEISDYCILDNLLRKRISGPNKNKIGDWIEGGIRGNVLMAALVNGYTVEEPTTEERITARLTSALIESRIESPIPTEHLAHQLTQAIREVLAEQPQEAN
ncbi:DUF1642 domain-containing protein [Paenibacillus thailandensis]|uniref:DUF1642 domain-containing protein n=1 Tax=Paenibacillus thailandensis TaxID=393250 RepID=A0ABW5R4U7_9BACL